MLLFIYILHSLNLTKGLDNTMIVPYRRKYSTGTLFLCFFTHISHVKCIKKYNTEVFAHVSVKTSEVMQHMETVNYPNS